MVRNTRKLARFNFYVLLFCALTFLAGGILSGFAAIILSGHTVASLFALLMCAGLLTLSGHAAYEMERF